MCCAVLAGGSGGGHSEFALAVISVGVPLQDTFVSTTKTRKDTMRRNSVLQAPEYTEGSVLPTRSTEPHPESSKIL